MTKAVSVRRQMLICGVVLHSRTLWTSLLCYCYYFECCYQHRCVLLVLLFATAITTLSDLAVSVPLLEWGLLLQVISMTCLQLFNIRRLL